jgi:hypothetical protein
VGEIYSLPIPGFNRSIRIEARAEKLSSEAGALPLREGLERLGMRDWLGARLADPRDAERTTHPFIELLTTSLLLMAQGWRDQDDADTLRDDPVLRLAVSERRGTSPLDGPPVGEDGAPVRDGTPHGLASQPTLSRMVGYLSTEENRAVLREALVVGAGRRIRAMRGHRHRHATIDVDSLPVEVHGHQPGSEYNAHYHGTIYHPLVASLGEHGDILDVQLRKGKVHTADGAPDFILSLVDHVEREVCQVASVRMDAGFPSEPLLAGLEERQRPVPYVARLRNNPVLDRMAEPYIRALTPIPDDAEHEMWFYEHHYQAGSWSRARRVVLVVQQRPGELFPHHFWLLTSWSAEQMPAATLLGHYRKRGSAEDIFGQWMSTLGPALSSTNRTKSHYRGKEVRERQAPRDAFAANEVVLLLNALAYNAMHVLRTLLEQATGRGWRMAQVREQVLKVAARILQSGRRITVVVPRAIAPLWSALWGRLGRLSVPAAPVATT